jgi:hypothetical protein
LFNPFSPAPPHPITTTNKADPSTPQVVPLLSIAPGPLLLDVHNTSHPLARARARRGGDRRSASSALILAGMSGARR